MGYEAVEKRLVDDDQNSPAKVVSGTDSNLNVSFVVLRFRRRPISAFEYSVLDDGVDDVV